MEFTWVSFRDANIYCLALVRWAGISRISRSRLIPCSWKISGESRNVFNHTFRRWSWHTLSFRYTTCTELSLRVIGIIWVNRVTNSSVREFCVDMPEYDNEQILHALLLDCRSSKESDHCFSGLSHRIKTHPYKKASFGITLDQANPAQKNRYQDSVKICTG